MTPLMHAAYKGKADMCKLLLQHGADVNCNEHEHGYTALMFAGLSGKTFSILVLIVPTASLKNQLFFMKCCDFPPFVPVGKTDITWMMLDAGAETDVVNSVGRTAAQMAAFVGTFEVMVQFQVSVVYTQRQKDGDKTFLVRKKTL